MTAIPKQISLALDQQPLEPKPSVADENSRAELWDIAGMHCAGCAQKVENKLRQVAGITSARVNFTLGQAVIHRQIGAGGVDDAVLHATVQSLGYTLSRANANESQEETSGGIGLWLSSILLAAIFLTDMVLMWMGAVRLPWPALVILATAAQLGLGWNFYRQTARDVNNSALGMDSLIAIGTTAAFCLSLWQTAIFAMGAMASADWLWLSLPHTYFEASVIVLSFVTIGRAIEHWVQTRARMQLSNLADWLGDFATIIRDGKPQRIPTASLAPGDIVWVGAGERFPADGIVIDGSSDIDQSLFTGETVPVLKTSGDSIWGGSINLGQKITLRVTQAGAATRLGFVRDLAQLAVQNKSPLAEKIDRICYQFVPGVLALAAGTFALWAAWDLSHEAGIGRAVLNAVSVLVIACPCALGLAIPTALVNCVRLAGRQGILIKDGGVFDALATVNQVVLDKTGTLTLGKPQVSDTIALSGDSHQLLRLAASCLANSRHPLAQAVFEQAQKQKLQLLTPQSVTEVAGKGLRAEFVQTRPGNEPMGQIAINKFTLFVGSRRWLNDNNFDLSPAESASAELSLSAKSMVYIGWQGDGDQRRVMGVLGLQDQLREGSRRLLQFFSRRKLSVLLLSGDNRATVEQVAAQLGIDQAQGDILPEEKAGRIKSLRARGRRVIMLGDGLNDAPALAQADIGVAMGAGSALAMQAAKVGLSRNDPAQILDLFAIGALYRRKVNQNLFWAFGFNVIAIPLAAMGMIHPSLAGSIMAASSILVLGNSALIFKAKG